jgi:hypothetical protein
VNEESTPADGKGTGNHRLNRWSLLLVAGGCAGVILGLSAVSILVPSPGPVVAYVIAFVAVTGMTLAAATVAPVSSWKELLVVMPLTVAVLYGVFRLGSDSSSPQVLSAVVVTAALLVGGASLGGAVGGRIEHPGHLLAVVVVSLLVDTFSVFHSAGPTAAVVERPEMLVLLALPFPVLGTEVIAPVLGVGDVIFAALYMAAARRFDLGLRRTAIALAVGLLVTMTAVMITALPLPALVGMGIAVLLVHPRARRLPKRDRRKAIIVMGVLGALWLFLFLRS